MNRTLLVLLLLASGPPALRADETVMLAGPAPRPEAVTGNLAVDFFGIRDLDEPRALMQVQTEKSGTPDKKSAFLAGGMSLLVPGAGQIYNGDYWQAALFLAAEAVLWTVAASNDKKGDDQTAMFEAYADAGWDVVQYAEFSAAVYLTPAERAQFAWYVPNAGRPPWEQVNWSELNRMERYIGGNAANRQGQYYSHTLPVHGEQQYFELIGKYQQYYQGWDDADPALTTYDQITARLAQGNTMFTTYSQQRGEANDYYSAASTAVTIVVVNHVLSALEAAWGASRHNKRIDAEMALQDLPVPGGRATTLRVAWRF